MRRQWRIVYEGGVAFFDGDKKEDAIEAFDKEHPARGKGDVIEVSPMLSEDEDGKKIYEGEFAKL